jgi:hypothetical protein
MKLARRDWILLPLLSLLTMAVILISTEAISRAVFSESQKTLNSCLVLTDSTTGVRGVPNSSCWEKMPETEPIEYKFDCAGFRSNMPCGPKPPGTYRIVMTGSSIAIGERVPVEKTFGSLLPRELSGPDGRRVELYNEGMGFGFPRNIDLRFNAVLAAQPDLFLWIVTPLDFKLADYSYSEHPFENNGTDKGSASAIGMLKNFAHQHGGNPLRGTATALRHLLYAHASQDRYVQVYLSVPDNATGIFDTGAGYLKNPLPPAWRHYLKVFDEYAADIEGKAKAAGVPVAAVMIPARPQVAMISSGEYPAGYDPLIIDREVRAIMERHGATYVSIMSDFQKIPNAERYYYAIDGHPDPDGHALLAELIAKALGSGAIPKLRASGRAQIASAAEK